MLHREKIHRKIRQTIIGTSSRPRLAIYRSNRNIFAQLIDDNKGNTILSSSSLKNNGSLTQKAKEVGEDIAVKAKEAKIKQVVFDRAGFRYAGAIKIVAEAARQKGLEI